MKKINLIEEKMKKEFSEQAFLFPIVTRSNSTEEEISYSPLKESLLDSPSTLKYNLSNNNINEMYNKKEEQMYIKNKLININNKIDYLIENGSVKLENISLSDYYKLYECLMELLIITNNPSGDKIDDLNALNLQKKIIDIMILFLENNHNLINN